MNNYRLKLKIGEQFRNFELVEYMSPDIDRCKYHVLEKGVFLAAFTPDHNHCMQLCKNPGLLDEETVDFLADSLEVHVPLSRNIHYVDFSEVEGNRAADE